MGKRHKVANPKRFRVFLLIVVLVIAIPLIYVFASGVIGGDEKDKGSLPASSQGDDDAASQNGDNANADGDADLSAALMAVLGDDMQEVPKVVDSNRAPAETDKGLLMIVNKQFYLAEDYVPEDLVRVSKYAPNRDDSTRYLVKDAAAAYEEMIVDAATAGHDIALTSGYRSYQVQKGLFEYNTSVKGSEEEANKTSARAGESEHQTGLALDISIPYIDYRLITDFGEMAEGKWLRDNAHKYGFIMRYMNDKELITGYSYEPWHFRYVGKEVAEYIYEKGICYEEFVKNHQPSEE